MSNLFVKDARVLTLDASETEFARASIAVRGGTITAIAPDLPEPTPSAAVRQAVRTDDDAIVASDRSPAPPELKADEDFFSI